MATIQLRRGDAAAWTDANSVLAAGEVGLEMDTGKFKWGDGTTAWNDLAYIGGIPFGEDDREPLSAQNSEWTLTIVNDCTGGTFTLSITPSGGNTIVTGPIDHDADPDALQGVLDTALDEGNSTVSGDPLPTGTLTIDFQGDLELIDIDVEVDSNDLIGDTPAPTLNENRAGGLGDQLPAGAWWYDNDDNSLWINVGTADMPAWLQAGQLPSDASFASVTTGTLTVTPLNEGGAGFYTDEINIQQQDTEIAQASAIIAIGADPTADGGYTPDYQPGTIALRRDDPGTFGEVWLKTGASQGEWTRLATTADLA